MEKINFYDVGESIDNTDIIKVEKEFNVSFPDNYKKLLLRFNGGIPDSDIVFIGSGEGTIGGFYSIKHGDILLEDAIMDLQITESLIPREYLPIAYDVFGNPYCISLKNDEYGNIYCWYLDSDEEDGFLVANSLEEFLGGEV